MSATGHMYTTYVKVRARARGGGRGGGGGGEGTHGQRFQAQVLSGRWGCQGACPAAAATAVPLKDRTTRTNFALLDRGKNG